MSLLVALVILAAIGPGLYLFAAHVASHVHQPPVHPNGRCPICGLDAQEQTP